MLGAGDAEETFALDGGGLAWIGLASDPFWGDGFALAGFEEGLAAEKYHPEVFSAVPANVFDARNVTAIALRISNSTLGGDLVSRWARISLVGHAPRRQVSRMGNPMLRPLFFGTPGPDSEALNAGSPADGVRLHAEPLRHAAGKVAALRGLDDPAAHVSNVVRAFPSDVLTLRPGLPARYEPGAGNGRGLHDDAFGIALSVLHGSPIGGSTSRHPVVATSPHLAPADRQTCRPCSTSMACASRPCVELHVSRERSRSSGSRPTALRARGDARLGPRRRDSMLARADTLRDGRAGSGDRDEPTSPVYALPGPWSVADHRGHDRVVRGLTRRLRGSCWFAGDDLRCELTGAGRARVA